MLEFHQFEVGGNQIEIAEVSLPDHFLEGSPLLVKANRAIKSLVFADVELGLITMQSGETRLRIKIDREHSITSQCKVLGEVGRRRCLAAAALEIDDRDHL